MQIGLGLGISFPSQVAGFDAEAEAFFARAGALSSGRKSLINSLILGLRADLGITSLADIFDVLCVVNETEAASLINLAKNAHDATIAGSVTFAADRGLTGDGSTGYINTNCTLSTATRFAQDDCHLSVYSRTNRAGPASGKPLISVVHSAGVRISQIIPISGDANARLGITHDGSTSWIASPATEQGYYFIYRNLTASFRYLRNNAIVSARSVASTAPAAFPPFVLQNNLAGSPQASNYCDSQVAAWTIGKAPASDAQAIAIGARIEAYLDAIGAGILP